MATKDEEDLLWMRREKWFREFGAEDVEPLPGAEPLPRDCVEEFFISAASKGFDHLIPADLRLHGHEVS